MNLINAQPTIVTASCLTFVEENSITQKFIIFQLNNVEIILTAAVFM
jgi:hypothetical protein